MSAVEQVAAYAGLPTIPWSSMEASGQGLMQGDAYIKMLQDQRTRWAANAAAIGWTADEVAAAADNARQAWDAVYNEIARRSSGVLGALSRGELTVAAADAVQLPVDALRATVIACAAMADAGTRAHETYVVRWAVETNEWTEARAKQDADQVYGLYEGLNELAERGTLDPLKKAPAGTQGLGWWQAVVIVLGVLGAISILAWLVITWREQSYVYDLRRNRCFDKDNNPRVPFPVDCQAYFNNLAASPYGHLWAAFAPFTKAGESFGSSFGNALGWALGITALLYVGAVYILPRIDRPRP